MLYTQRRYRPGHDAPHLQFFVLLEADGRVGGFSACSSITPFMAYSRLTVYSLLMTASTIWPCLGSMERSTTSMSPSWMLAPVMESPITRKEEGRGFVAHQVRIEIEAILYLIIPAREGNSPDMRCCSKGSGQISGLAAACCRRGRQTAVPPGMKGIIVVCQTLFLGMTASIKRLSGRLQLGYVRTI